MRTYSLIKRLYVNELGRYLPVGTTIKRYETVNKIAVYNAPTSTSGVEGYQTIDNLEYDKPSDISWFINRLELNTEFFTLVSTGPDYGSGSTGSSTFTSDEFTTTSLQGTFPLSAVPVGDITWSLNGVVQGSSDVVVSSQVLYLSNDDASRIEGDDKIIISYIS